MVRVVHERVRGRVRLRLSSMKGCRSLADFMISFVMDQPGVRSVRVGIITGSLLIEYQAPLAHSDQVVRLVEEALDRYHQSQQKPALEPPKPSITHPNSVSSSRALSFLNGVMENKRRPSGPVVPWKSLCRSEGPGEGEKWHTKTPCECLTLLKSSLQGLHPEEAKARLMRDGPNDVEDGPVPSSWKLFAKQFMSLPVALLGAVSAVSLITGGLMDAVIISGVVVANAVVGYITEKSSNQAIAALRRIEESEALVVRGGKEWSVPRRDVVVGDIVVLRAGSSIPADGRLLEVDHLYVDESSLSGESLPVAKASHLTLSEHVPLHDRCNMVYRGTVVTGGSGLAVVTATGADTELGRLQRLLQYTEAPKAPIEYQLASLGDRLVLLCLAVCAVCFGIGILRGYGFLAMARLSLSLGAAAVPEGLPSAATTTFALAVRRMRRRGVLIRDLTAVESLGAIQVLCLDKTGTLTENRMTVQEIVAGGRHFSVSNDTISFNGTRISPHTHPSVQKILEIACLCHEARWQESTPGEFLIDGSPTETALIRLAMSNDMTARELYERHPPVWTILRSESRAYMASLHEATDGTSWLAIKGSPEAVLAFCDRKLDGHAVVTLSDVQRRRIMEENEALSKRGLRVLGFAYGFPNGSAKTIPENCVWCGLVAMADPIKAGAYETIRALRRAGLQVVMLTGDHELTASAVAKALDLAGGKPLKTLDASRFNGREEVSCQELVADEVHVFSRVSPSHKLRIVDMLRRSGKIVGMTGDGVNDAPALKAADVGVCMGRQGTEVSQQVANVVLENDDLTLLVVALEEGRTIQDNIKKSVHFFLSSNLSEILLIVVALAAGLPSLMNPMQLLWINLISDIFPGIALSMDPPEKDVLSRPPRPAHAPLFSGRDFGLMLRESSIMAGGALVGSLYGFLAGGPARASTLAFHVLTSSQLLHALNCRHSLEGTATEKEPANPTFNMCVAASLGAQFAAGMVPGLRQFLGLAPMGPLDWFLASAITATTAWINRKRRRAERPTEWLSRVLPEKPKELFVSSLPSPCAHFPVAEQSAEIQAL